MNSRSTDILSKILEKELELESNLTMDTLTSLVESYRSAIEHFEEIKSPKLWDYQERLQKILMRSAVLELMQAENQKYRSQHRTRKRALTHLPAPKPIQKSYTIDLPTPLPNTSIPEEPAPQTTDKLANRIVESQQKRTEDVITKAVSELKAQDRSLKDRLAGRKQKGLNISLNTSFGSKLGGFSLPHSPLNQDKEFFFEIGPEKSSGLNVFTTLHQRIEKIMEESFKEKTEKITDVKVKYGTQIGELEAQGGIYLEIVKEMRNSMSEEIKVISQEVDAKRKELILLAKRELGLVGK